MKKRIIILGLNPAWQRTLAFKSFRSGGINRCEKVEEYASGKGINAAFAAKKWKAASLVLQFAGGASGRALCRDLDIARILHDTVEIHNSTRLCQTLISSSQSTELIDPSPQVTAKEALLLSEKVNALKDSADFWVFAGTFPVGVTEKHLRTLLKDIPSSSLILDGIRGVKPILEHGIYILKINKQELFKLTGKKTVSGAWSELKKHYSIEHLIVTDGAKPVSWCSELKIRYYKIPECNKFLNPIGAGDAFTGTLAALLQKKMNLEKIIPMAIGAGVAKCEYSSSVGFSIQEAKIYARDVCQMNKA